MSDRISPYPLRMPQELRDAFESRAKDSGRSLNAEIVAALEQSADQSEAKSKDCVVKVIPMGENTKRIIYGKLLNHFDLDFTQDLSLIKSDIEMTLNVLKGSGLLMKFTFMRKDIRIHEGGNHLDIIDNGVGTLNWLSVEDRFVANK